MARGEKLLASAAGVVDTKQQQLNNQGILLLTNCRVVFVETRRGRSLSVGLNAITNCGLRRLHTVGGNAGGGGGLGSSGGGGGGGGGSGGNDGGNRLTSARVALVLRAASLQGSRLEFVFAHPTKGMDAFAARARRAHRSFLATRSFRELQFSAALFSPPMRTGGTGGGGGGGGGGRRGLGSSGLDQYHHHHHHHSGGPRSSRGCGGEGDGECRLWLLPDEELVSVHRGIFSVSLSEGTMGTLAVTSLRVAW